MNARDPQTDAASRALPGARPASTPDLSVVVPTWRRPDLLERCLDALTHQTLAPERYEVIVCDDGPDDATREVAQRFAAAHEARGLTIHYLPIRASQGPAAARNAGWRHALAPVIAFTDEIGRAHV